MRWIQMDKWHLELEGTGYKVSKGWFRSEGQTESQIRYTAWAPKPHKYAQPELLDIKSTPQEAMQVCEEHRTGKHQ